MSYFGDLLRAINERTIEHFWRIGLKPDVLALSPTTYRILTGMVSLEEHVEARLNESVVVRRLRTPLGRIQVVINEMLPDAEIALS